MISDSDDNTHLITHYLDDNGFIPLTLRVSKKSLHANELTLHLDATIDLSAVDSAELRSALNGLSAIDINGIKYRFDTDPDNDNLLRLRQDIRTEQQNPRLNIEINSVTNGIYHISEDGLQADPQNSDLRLTESETRMMSHFMTQYQLEHLPYPRPYAGKIGPQHLPKTDLHTHLSAQLSGQELLDLSIEHKLTYPSELLDAMGIDHAQCTDVEAKTYRFEPAINTATALDCEKATGNWVTGVDLQELKSKQPDSYYRLAQLLSIPFDQTQGPDDFDKYLYRYRNPLEKNEALAKAKILAVAKKYQEQGIEYAELSTGAMFNPKWLKEAIPSIQEAESTYGVKLRLLVGIPRTADPNDVSRMVEKIKFLGQNPYIVGVDFLGFEGNKTSDFSWAIYNLARWARRLKNTKPEVDKKTQYYDDFVIRVHAGENNENIKNTEEVIDIAEKFGVTTRVGHAIDAGNNPDLLEKAKHANVTFEALPASWIALSNRVDLHGLPLKKLIDSGVNLVLGSDGAGAYQTNSRQGVRNLLAAGLTLDDLVKMQAKEEAYIQQRHDTFKKKTAWYERHFTSLEHFVEEYEKHAQTIDQTIEQTGLPNRYKAKKPILFAGASGSSWEAISEAHKEEIHIATRMMVDMLDPDKVYFATGRVKDRGVEKELDSAIEQHDAQHWHEAPPFDMIATIAPDDGEVKVANGVTWVNKIAGKAMNVARPVMELIHNANGLAMLIGGKVLTGELIREARRQKVAYALAQGPEGAAHDESLRTRSDHVMAARPDAYNLAESMLLHIYENLGAEVFRTQIQTRIEDAKRAIMLESPDNQWDKTEQAKAAFIRVAKEKRATVIKTYNGIHPDTRLAADTIKANSPTAEASAGLPY